MGIRYTKASLYKEIDRLRNTILGSDLEYPFDVIDWCQNSNIPVDYMSMKRTPGLQGIVYFSCEPGGKDVIILNSDRTVAEQAFYCAHELIHLKLHRHVGIQSFSCYEKVRPKQDPYFEWQANQGAAELLVPYKSFIPKIRDVYPDLHTWQDYDRLVDHLSKQYGVSSTVIQFRFEDLKYEIGQYLFNDVPIDRLHILSAKSQKGLGIQATTIEQKVDNHERNTLLKTRGR